MKAFEFQTNLTPSQTLALPDELKAQLSPGSSVRVILLLPEPVEEAEWKHLTAEQFFRGYAESDRIYDQL
ncbi:MAG: hypothetical protein L0Y55_03310 [Anaerolineales bacterium]|nr:hypothetical protein [Anaerolineales bacterium]